MVNHHNNIGQTVVEALLGGSDKVKKANKKHPGFEKVQEKIAKKEGVSKKAAGAILASASRKTSSKAKRANPKLKKVKKAKK